jgi:hypothetical protein
MSYVNRSILTATALVFGLSLSACSSGSDFDPTDYMPNNWFGGGKKPFPGERRAVFPGGVPGVAQGVPREMMVGHQAAPEETPAADATAEPAAKAAVKPKPKKKISAAQAQPAAAAPSRPAQSAASPWPDPAKPAAPAQQNAWPPPNTNTFSR